MARASLDGVATWQSRRYRIAEVASGRDDTEFQARAQLLFRESALWQIMPPHFRTIHFRCLAFRMVSRMACSQWELLGRPHQQFPYRMFMLLSDPSLAHDILQVPDCVMGAWAQHLRARFPELSGDEFYAILAEAAMRMMVDTSVIEAKHATIRRLLLLASQNTHTLQGGALSARWVLNQCRIGGRKGRPAARKKKPKKGAARLRVKKIAKQQDSKKSRAGPFRAFIRLRTANMKLGIRPNWRDIAVDYRDNKARKTPLYLKAVALGKSGLQRSRADPRVASGKTSPFGSRVRDTERHQLRNLSEMMWLRTAELDKESRMLAVTARCMEMNMTMEESLQHARRVERCALISERAAASAAEDLLRHWTTRHADDDRALKNMIPTLSEHAATSIPCPDNVSIFDCTEQDASIAVGAVAWATANSQASPLGKTLRSIGTANINSCRSAPVKNSQRQVPAAIASEQACACARERASH